MMQPGTMPAPMKRRPIDLSLLPPEMQQRLANGETITYEDGSVIYPDGTATGAGDSPNDYGFDYGGYGGQLTGQPGTMPAEDKGPFAGPLFKRFRQVSKAPFPGTPGGIGGGPIPDPMNPMKDPMMDPFAPAETARSVTSGGSSINGSNVTATPTPSPDYKQMDDPMKKQQGPMYPGRYGRRMASRSLGGRRRG